jgi:CBS domain-containing protein
MRARDVMVGATVTTTPETTIKELARLMINHRISGVPVIDRNARLVGNVTEGDLLRRTETGTEHKRTPWREGVCFRILAWPPITLNHTPDKWQTS